jgi:hypothetical protein
MRTLFIILASLAWLLQAGCSGSSDTRQPSTGGVWKSDSVGFSLHVRGGMTALAQTYTYDHATRALSSLCQNQCYVDGGYSAQPVERAVELSETQDADLVQQLQSLRESTDRTQCGADAPDLDLAIKESSGSQTEYTSDFYAGCQGRTTGEHLIQFDALWKLRSTLGQLLPQ